MPVILTQHYSPADRVYADVEYSLYHYPRQYFGRVRPYDRFIYYRPLGQSRQRSDSKHYFGHGLLGQWWPDPERDDHRYVALIQADPFPRLVPLYDSLGGFVETESVVAPQFQSAVRDLSETAYWKILALADVKAAGISFLPSTELVASGPYVGTPTAAPRDAFREINEIPAGAGYVPHGDTIVNVYESAALQERARADHQVVLKRIQREVHKRGGTTWYNNNVDLFARLGNSRMLFEAKSLANLNSAIDRMRYGVGQLADYAFRYEDEVGNGDRILAFGQPPNRETSWISTLLEKENVAFIAALGDGLVALNPRAASLPIFS